MKIIKPIICLLIVAVTLTSCGKKTDEQIITANVKAFAKALYTGNFEKAATYCTAEAGESIASIPNLMPEDVIKDMKKTNPIVEILEISIDELNLTALVRCVLSNAYDLNSGISTEDIPTSFVLHKDGKKWLIN